FTSHSSCVFKQLLRSRRESNFGRRGANYSERPRETHCLKSSEKDLIKAEAFRRYAMNSSRWRNLGISGLACLLVIGLLVGALRPKRASGAGTGTPPDVMVAQVEQRD